MIHSNFLSLPHCIDKKYTKWTMIRLRCAASGSLQKVVSALQRKRGDLFLFIGCVIYRGLISEKKKCTIYDPYKQHLKSPHTKIVLKGQAKNVDFLNILSNAAHFWLHPFLEYTWSHLCMSRDKQVVSPILGMECLRTYLKLQHRCKTNTRLKKFFFLTLCS